MACIKMLSFAGQQLEKAAQGVSPEDGAEVRGPHATLAVKLQVGSLYFIYSPEHLKKC